MTILNLEVGQTATIDKVNDNQKGVTRLMEMGMIPGEKITLRGKAPFGDPLRILVMGYEVCIRKKDAQNFLVKDIELVE